MFKINCLFNTDSEYTTYYQLPVGVAIRGFTFYQNNFKVIDVKFLKHYINAYNKMYLKVYRRGEMKAKILKISMKEYGDFLYLLQNI